MRVCAEAVGTTEELTVVGQTKLNASKTMSNEISAKLYGTD